jgi:hypothetical protein
MMLYVKEKSLFLGSESLIHSPINADDKIIVKGIFFPIFQDLFFLGYLS